MSEKLINFLSHNSCFSWNFFVWKCQSKLSWAKESATPTDMTSRNGLIHIQSLLLLYHHIFDIYIQTQWNSAPDASVGANNVSSDGLDQITNHDDNMDGKDNDY